MATLQISKKLHITPLIDIQSPTFAQRYVSGVCWRLFGWREHGEVEAHSVGPLVVPLGNSPGDSSRSPDRNNRVTIPCQRFSV